MLLYMSVIDRVLYAPQNNLHTPTLNKSNMNNIAVDCNFIKKSNVSLQNKSNSSILHKIRETKYSHLFSHPKQLYNIFEDITISNDKHNIYIERLNEVYHLSNFIKLVEKFSLEDFTKLTLRIHDNKNFKSNKLLLLVFIGDINCGIRLIDSILKYYDIETFSIAFCIKKRIADNMVAFIKQKFQDNYIIYLSNEFGNDITPSLLMYNEILKSFHFEYIMKLHTKTHHDIFNASVQFLLSKTLIELLSLTNDNCSSIGYLYINCKNDKYNLLLYEKHKNIIINSEFVHATMFLTIHSKMKKIIDFFNENYYVYFLQTMYDDNTINSNNSIVHFTERLFGYI